MPSAAELPHWPYPRWIAHRGAGRLAPENTLAAFAMGARYGYRMFECDVRLSADGMPFLLHDDRLERTTNGHGPAGDLPWHALHQLDAGRWHSATFAGEAPPSLTDIARFCLDRGLMLNIEIKPGPGLTAITGGTVARVAQQLWSEWPDAPLPLLSSFQADALSAAREAAPGLPRGLLLGHLDARWLRTTLELGCIAVIAQHRAWTAAALQEAKAAGLRCLAYTVNEPADAAKLVDWGIDGLITDRVDLFTPG